MRLPAFAALLLVAAAPPPPAGEWVHFFDHPGNGVSHSDSGSVERDGSRVRMLARWDRSGVPNAPFAEGRILNEIDCATRRQRILRYAAYASDGSVVVERDEPLGWESIQERTVGARLAERLCPAR